MADEKRLRVFLDANILIRGTTLPRFPYEVLRHAARGDFIPVFSPMVLDSARLYIQELFPDYAEALEVLLALLKGELIPDPLPEEVAAQGNLMRDAKDIPVALAAIHATVVTLLLAAARTDMCVIRLTSARFYMNWPCQSCSLLGGR